jgi:hypothetical protein
MRGICTWKIISINKNYRDLRRNFVDWIQLAQNNVQWRGGQCLIWIVEPRREREYPVAVLNIGFNKSNKLYRALEKNCSSASVVSEYRLDDRGSIPNRGKWFFFLPLCPDQLWGPPSLLSNLYQFLQWTEKSRPIVRDLCIPVPNSTLKRTPSTE